MRNTRCGIVHGARTMRKSLFVSLASVALVALAISVPAYANLVVNGGFESTTSGPDLQLGYNTNETGWTVPDPHSGGSYFFVYAPGDADATGALGQYGIVELWGPGDGSANGLPPASPAGGNFVAADGAFQPGAISQTISGLTLGANYTVSFWWAAAQENTRTGASQTQWLVSFGSSTQSTPFASITSEGFSGWMSQSFTFKADGGSDVLSFLANGTPAGVPPFALLDGVTVTQNTTPEPSTLMLMGTGMVGVFGLGRRYYSRKRG